MKTSEIKVADIELIKHAAVKCYSGMTMLGKSHADCIHKAMHIGIGIRPGADMQGFFTNMGRFVTRTEAAKIALSAGMVSEKRVGKLLFSEDLWSPEGGGIYTYDYVKGYEF